MISLLPHTFPKPSHPLSTLHSEGPGKGRVGLHSPEKMQLWQPQRSPALSQACQVIVPCIDMPQLRTPQVLRAALWGQTADPSHNLLISRELLGSQRFLLGVKSSVRGFVYTTQYTANDSTRMAHLRPSTSNKYSLSNCYFSTVLDAESTAINREQREIPAFTALITFLFKFTVFMYLFCLHVGFL